MHGLWWSAAVVLDDDDDNVLVGYDEDEEDVRELYFVLPFNTKSVSRATSNIDEKMSS